MIPLRDQNPTEITPYATIAFIAANLIVWMMVQGAGAPGALEASVTDYGFVPCRITGECASNPGGFASIVTSMFLHGSWEHLIGNLVFLWVFGNNIEDSMGHIRFVLFYFLCGFGAAAAHTYFEAASGVPAVGASGAISGVMGAYVLLYPKVKVTTWFPPLFIFPVSALFFLGYWFVLQLGMGLITLGPEAGETGGVAVWAHVGGFVMGLILIKLFEKRELTYAKQHHIKLSEAEAKRLEW